MKLRNLVLATVVLGAWANYSQAAQEQKNNADALYKEGTAVFDGTKNTAGSPAQGVAAPNPGNSASSGDNAGLAQLGAGSGGLDSVKQYLEKRSGFYGNRARAEAKKTTLGTAVAGGAMGALTVFKNMFTPLLPMVGYVVAGLGLGLMGYEIYKLAKSWKQQGNLRKNLNVMKIGALAGVSIAVLSNPIGLALTGLLGIAALGVGFAIRHLFPSLLAKSRANFLRKEAQASGSEQ